MGGRGDVFDPRQVGQKFGQFRLGHLQWMTLVVKQDKTPNPACVGFLGAGAEVFTPDGVSNLFKKFRLVRGKGSG